ncbi:hypothetical protein FB451DRAFT_712514 [Mycena latifolia]|nr:hypothetical protein FB451DRAFT_712514 [Mycena latifolia]
MAGLVGACIFLFVFFFHLYRMCILRIFFHYVYSICMYITGSCLDYRSFFPFFLLHPPTMSQQKKSENGAVRSLANCVDSESPPCFRMILQPEAGHERRRGDVERVR